MHIHISKGEVMEFLKSGDMKDLRSRIWVESENCDHCRDIFLAACDEEAKEHASTHPEFAEQVERAQAFALRWVESRRRKRLS